MSALTSQLHWTQRVALVRHNLHTASRSGDFSFFKALQAGALLDGTNHLVSLTAALGDEADMVTSALDNLNAGLAYSHQDAFYAIYDGLKNNTHDTSSVYLDIVMQRSMLNTAIDTAFTAATALIDMQPESAQREAASILILGTTLIADSIEISLKQMNALENNCYDYVRMDQSWNIVKTSVACAVFGLKGIFTLMDASSQSLNDTEPSRNRNSSFASASGAVFRRLSNAFAATTLQTASSDDFDQLNSFPSTISCDTVQQIPSSMPMTCCTTANDEPKGSRRSQAQCLSSE